MFPISSDVSGGFRSLVYSKIRTWEQSWDRRSWGSCRIPFSISEGTGALASVVCLDPIDVQHPPPCPLTKP